MIKRLRRAWKLTRDERFARVQVGGLSISRSAIKPIEPGEREVTDIEPKKPARAQRVSAALLEK